MSLDSRSSGGLNSIVFFLALFFLPMCEMMGNSHTIKHIEGSRLPVSDRPRSRRMSQPARTLERPSSRGSVKVHLFPPPPSRLKNQPKNKDPHILNGRIGHCSESKCRRFQAKPVMFEKGWWKNLVLPLNSPPEKSR